MLPLAIILIHILFSVLLFIVQVIAALLMASIVILTLLECAVATIQVFIFTVLISTYANS
mgnify:CR=1 FL=1